MAAVWESLGDVTELAALYADAEEAYGGARPLDGHPRLLHKEGLIRERIGPLRRGARWYDRGLACARVAPAGGERAERFELGLAYAGVRFRQGEFAGLRRLVQPSVEEAGRSRTCQRSPTPTT